MSRGHKNETETMYFTSNFKEELLAENYQDKQDVHMLSTIHKTTNGTFE